MRPGSAMNVEEGVMPLRDRGKRGLRQRLATVVAIRARKFQSAYSARIDNAKSRAKSYMSWVEDHAERVITIFVALWLLVVVAAVSLWSWAQVISIAIGLAALLTIVVVTVSTAAATLNWLRGRRNRRVAHNRVDAPVLGTQPSPAIQPPVRAPSENEELRFGSLKEGEFNDSETRGP
jgi:hypothetical protein